MVVNVLSVNCMLSAQAASSPADTSVQLPISGLADPLSVALTAPLGAAAAPAPFGEQLATATVAATKIKVRPKPLMFDKPHLVRSATAPAVVAPICQLVDHVEAAAPTTFEHIRARCPPNCTQHRRALS